MKVSRNIKYLLHDKIVSAMLWAIFSLGSTMICHSVSQRTKIFLIQIYT